MTKSELEEQLAKETSLPQAQAPKALEAILAKTTKTLKCLRLVSLLGFTVFFIGCSEAQKHNTAAVELNGNPTTGYTWVYTMSPEGVLREISNEYIPDNTVEGVVGSGGKYIFTFEALINGETELIFSYLRAWEEDTPVEATIAYRATVDDRTGLTLTQK